MAESKKLPTGVIDLRDITIEQKRFVYSTYFTLGTNTPQCLDHKLELITLIVGLTQKMQKHFPGDWKTSYDVLQNYVFKDSSLEFGDKEFVTNLSILADDMMYGIQEVELKYKSSQEVKVRIQELVAEWLPF